MRLPRRIVSVVVIGLLLGACASGGGADMGATSGGGEGAGGAADGAIAEERSLDDADTSAPQAIGLGEGNDSGQLDTYQERDALQLGSSVIKTADLELEIAKADFRSAVREATTVAERYGGFIVSSSVDDARQGSASATLRVPAENFATALGALRELGSVDREEIGGEDVSQELVDLEARLRNYRAQERVLLNLMAEARSVADTIRVQNQLSGIQLEVERLRGRLRYLDDRVTYSTIFVQMREKGAPPPPKSGALQDAWNNAAEGFFAVISFVIVAAGVLLPSGVMALIIYLIVRWARPRVTRRLGTEKV